PATGPAAGRVLRPVCRPEVRLEARRPIQDGASYAGGEEVTPRRRGGDIRDGGRRSEALRFSHRSDHGTRHEPVRRGCFEGGLREQPTAASAVVSGIAGGWDRGGGGYCSPKDSQTPHAPPSYL